MSVINVPDQVLRVCRDHVVTAPRTQRILWFPSAEGEPIRLLEVDESALPGDAVWSFKFAATGDYPAIHVATVTPEEFERVAAGEKGWELPEGWDWTQRVEIDLASLGAGRGERQ